MRNMMLFIALFPFTKIHTATPAPQEVRELYRLAASNKAACEKLTVLLQPFDEKNNPVMAGYKACATMMMARHVINPYTKLGYFSEGKNLLEKCIAANKNSNELRFLRFTIQVNSPAFLGYKSAIPTDKTFLLQTFPTLKDAHLKQLIRTFLMDCSLLTQTEKQSLKS